MKKLVLFLALGCFLFANNLPLDMVCKKVQKSTIEEALAIKFKKEKVGKLPFEAPYDVSFCEYLNGVLPDVTLYYYYKSKANVYPPDSKVEELNNLEFPARVVYSKNGDIYEVIGNTKEGKLLFVFNNGIKKDTAQYKNIISLLSRLVKEFD